MLYSLSSAIIKTRWLKVDSEASRLLTISDLVTTSEEALERIALAASAAIRSNAEPRYVSPQIGLEQSEKST